MRQTPNPLRQPACSRPKRVARGVPQAGLGSSGSMADALRFWTALSLPHVMVKLLGTSAGAPANVSPEAGRDR